MIETKTKTSLQSNFNEPSGTETVSTLEMTVLLQRNSLFYKQLISVPLIGNFKLLINFKIKIVFFYFKGFSFWWFHIQWILFIPHGKDVNAFTGLSMDFFIVFCVFFSSLNCSVLSASFTIILGGTFHSNHVECSEFIHFDSNALDTCWSCTKSLYTDYRQVLTHTNTSIYL